MSNPDRVVKVGQIWKCTVESFCTIRAVVVIITRGSDSFATLRDRDGGAWRMNLQSDGTPKHDHWIRVSRPKPKVDAAAVERERIAKLHDKAAREFIRSPIPVISGVAHNTALGMSAMLVAWHEDQAMWLREGAK